MRADRVADLSTGERRRAVHATDDKASSSNESDANIINLNSRTSLSRKELPGQHTSHLGKDSLMRIRTFRRHSVMAVALAGLVLSAVGCNGDSNAEPEPLPSSSSTSPSSPATSPTPTPSGWESEFTEEQLAEYQAALGRWEDYEREAAPLWADPKPTAETLKFFASYFYNEDFMQHLLKLYADPDVEVKGTAQVLVDTVGGWFSGRVCG